MAYDPKKKRPKRDSLDSVVDEIFGEDEKPKDTPAAKATKSTTSSTVKKTPKTTAKKATEKSASPVAKSLSPDQEQDNRIPDNVTPIRPEPETPLVMQPQVWVATGIAALLLLVAVRRRRKRR